MRRYEHLSVLIVPPVDPFHPLQKGGDCQRLVESIAQQIAYAALTPPIVRVSRVRADLVVLLGTTIESFDRHRLPRDISATVWLVPKHTSQTPSRWCRDTWDTRFPIYYRDVLEILGAVSETLHDIDQMWQREPALPWPTERASFGAGLTKPALPPSFDEDSITAVEPRLVLAGT